MQVSNSCNFIGRLTRDPELRFIPSSGKAVVNVTIAVEDEFDRQNDDKTLFMDGFCFGKGAEVIAQYCKKGKMFAMGGKLKPEKWEDQNGNKRSKIKLFIEGFKILEWASSGNQQQGQQSYQQQNSYQQPQQQQSQGYQQQPQQPQQQQNSYQDDFNGFQAIDGDDDVFF